MKAIHEWPNVCLICASIARGGVAVILGVIRNEEYDLVNFEFSETAIIKMTFEDLVYDCLALTMNKRCLQYAKIQTLLFNSVLSTLIS